MALRRGRSAELIGVGRPATYRLGRRIGERKVSSAAGGLVRDLTLGAFLRMGARATAEQYGHRVPDLPAHHAVDGP